MRINISRSVRKVELTKREKKTLVEAMDLLAELGNVMAHEGSEHAKAGSDAIEHVMEALEGKEIELPY